MLHIATALPEKGDRTIYGVGNSPDDAIADAESYGADAPFATYHCSYRLWDRVISSGGAYIPWTLDSNGHADLIP